LTGVLGLLVVRASLRLDLVGVPLLSLYGCWWPIVVFS
jgi:hypothetical protein